MKIKYEIIIVTLLWLIVGALFHKQEPLQINDGKGVRMKINKRAKKSLNMKILSLKWIKYYLIIKLHL